LKRIKRPLPFFATTAVVCLLVSLGGYGCGEAISPLPPPNLYQLRTIGFAYALATDNLDHPPSNKAELLPFLKEVAKSDDSPAELLRSKVDGEEFVIHWGFDCRSIGGTPVKMPVLAYEKAGKDGKRLVLQSYRYASQVTEEQFAELPFPPGFARP
jgi:hypothetical protein